jgi:ABC-type nitrate/sulfonate/bicarbonate transport system ATPase subunit
MAATAAGITVRGLHKIFRHKGRVVEALQDIHLEIKPGQFLALVGSSGCGKTTLLRILLGLERDFEGEALLDGAPITGPGLDRGIVFQEHRLLPWLTLKENVAFGLRGVLDRAERELRIARVIHLVGLEGFENAYPGQLSGGMAQRTAIARALVNRPKVLLLDEPLGALDALTRLKLQRELDALLRAEGVTTVLVTHDIEEAVYFSDRVAVLSARPGRLKRSLAVHLPRPRDRNSREFLALKDELLEEFQLAEHPDPDSKIEYAI